MSIIGRRARAAAALIILMSLAVASSAEAQGVDLKSTRHRSHYKREGISRVREWSVESEEIPESFDGFKMVFVTDTHYPSKFTDRTLEGLRRLLIEISPDALLLGGDYQEGCEWVEPLMAGLMDCKPRYGAYAVMGNNDFERCTAEIYESMERNGIKLVENDTASIWKGGERIIIAGAHNTFKRRETTPSPTLKLREEDLVILLTHTPDYVEDQNIKNTDLALAGHTHGGQVTLFNLWAPVTASHYGQRFRRGLKYNSAGQPIIISTGIGTSRKKIRIFASSEVLIITLHSKKG